MNTQSSQAARSIGTPVLGGALVAATVVFGILLLRVGWHPDDVLLIGEFDNSTYGDAWSSSFLGRFYRPLTITLLRVSVDLFGPTALPLRLLQVGLIMLTVWLVIGLFPRSPKTASYLGGFCVLASPFTFISITPFGLGFADSIVAICLLLCFKLAAKDRRHVPTAALSVLLCLVAVFFKESGVLVVAFCVLECALRRRWRLAAGFVALALAYLWLRSSVVSHTAFTFSSGVWFKTHTTQELIGRFGDSPLPIYAYNVIGNATSTILYIPLRGLFVVTVVSALVGAVLLFTAAVTARFLWTLLCKREFTKPMAALALVFPLNAILGYMYIRPRIMFVAYSAVAVLVVAAVSDLLKHQRRTLGLSPRVVVISLVVSWSALWASSVARLLRQGAASL